MNKIIIIALILTGVFLSATENTFSITGEITFRKKGPIYIGLVNEEFKEGDDQNPEFGQIIQVEDLDMKLKTVSFIFNNVPSGVYGIRIFQDLNDNEELDSGAFGPKEPWGMSNNIRPKFRGPTFDEIKFEVLANVSDMNITIN